MADLTINPDLVLVISGTPASSDSGVAISAGKSVYLDSDSLYQLGDPTARRTTLGIGVNNAGIGQPLSVLHSGTLDLGVVLGQGLLYVMTPAGGIALYDDGDLVATQFINILGYGNDLGYLVMGSYTVPFALV